jgi:hypothetical protein
MRMRIVGSWQLSSCEENEYYVNFAGSVRTMVTRRSIMEWHTTKLVSKISVNIILRGNSAFDEWFPSSTAILGPTGALFRPCTPLFQCTALTQEHEQMAGTVTQSADFGCFTEQLFLFHVMDDSKVGTPALCRLCLFDNPILEDSDVFV